MTGGTWRTCKWTVSAGCRVWSPRGCDRSRPRRTGSRRFPEFLLRGLNDRAADPGESSRCVMSSRMIYSNALGPPRNLSGDQIHHLSLFSEQAWCSRRGWGSRRGRHNLCDDKRNDTDDQKGGERVHEKPSQRMIGKIGLSNDHAQRSGPSRASIDSPISGGFEIDLMTTRFEGAIVTVSFGLSGVPELGTVLNLEIAVQAQS